MPWTFSHPAAVLPLRRFTPKLLNFAALVAGSISPDLCYYLRWEIGEFTHTSAGAIVACVPFGIVSLALFYWLREPICFLLPSRHRNALLPLATSPKPEINLVNGIIILVSLVLGAWTHNFWDAFTHHGGFFVHRIPALAAPSFLNMPVFYWLQHVSTLFGIIVLCVTYRRWLRGIPERDAESRLADARGDRWRLLLLGGLGLVSITAACPIAYSGASLFHGTHAFRVFLFQGAVYSTAVFAVLLVISALLLAKRRVV